MCLVFPNKAAPKRESLGRIAVLDTEGRGVKHSFLKVTFNHFAVYCANFTNGVNGI